LCLRPRKPAARKQQPRPEQVAETQANSHPKAQSRHGPHKQTKAWPPRVLSETVGRNQTGLSLDLGAPKASTLEVREMLPALRTTRSELRREARRFFRLPLATSH